MHEEKCSKQLVKCFFSALLPLDHTMQSCKRKSFDLFLLFFFSSFNCVRFVQGYAECCCYPRLFCYFNWVPLSLFYLLHFLFFLFLTVVSQARNSVVLSRIPRPGRAESYKEKKYIDRKNSLNICHDTLQVFQAFLFNYHFGGGGGGGERRAERR